MRAANTAFDRWLEDAHPDVLLTPAQHAWVDALEQGHVVVWGGGRASGRTFVSELYDEYLKSNKKGSKA